MRRAGSLDAAIWAKYGPRCSCGRFVSLAKPHGWYAYGEYGQETGYICSSCVKTWVPRDGRGRGPEAGYCGVILRRRGEGAVA